MAFVKSEGSYLSCLVPEPGNTEMIGQGCHPETIARSRLMKEAQSPGNREERVAQEETLEQGIKSEVDGR